MSVLQDLAGSSLGAQTVKRLPTMRETRVRSPGWEDLLEKEMATHSRTLAWKIPWTEEPGRLQSLGSRRVGYDWATSMSCSMSVPLVTQPEIKPALWAVRTWSPNHWTPWEFPCLAFMHVSQNHLEKAHLFTHMFHMLCWRYWILSPHLGWLIHTLKNKDL